MNEKFVIVQLEKLDLLFGEIQAIKEAVKKLQYEKELPELLSVPEAEKELRLSKQRIYNLIYSHKLKAIQHSPNGKVLIHRDEIMRYKEQNVKAL